MTPQEQIRVIAEVDGWSIYCNERTFLQWHVKDPKGGTEYIGDTKHGEILSIADVVIHFPVYLTSYDAILPVLQKQNRAVQVRMMRLIAGNFGVEVGWEATPAQLCEAPLRALGKWKESK